MDTSLLQRFFFKDLKLHLSNFVHYGGKITPQKQADRHPFLGAYPGLFRAGSRKSEAQTSFIPSHILQLPLGDPKVFRGQMGHVIPPTCSGSAPRSPPKWVSLGNLQRDGRCTGDILTKMPDPPQLELYRNVKAL